jgi:hypothetical protein
MPWPLRLSRSSLSLHAFGAAHTSRLSRILKAIDPGLVLFVPLLLNNDGLFASLLQVKRLADLVAVGVGGGADENDALTPLLMFFENISAAPGGATLMTSTAEEYNFMLLSIARQMASSNGARQLCSAGALKNCCFERTVHPFIAEHVELAALLCLPLVGDREGFDEEDIKDMPTGLGRKCRIGGKVSENVELREVVYETMMLLCRTREGREYLRDSKIYPVIRE